jgi:peroxiredoxin Q/BCP
MKHLKVGEKAPDFSAKDQNGREVTLANYAGKRLVIYFYPKDNTPGCTIQACNLRDNFGTLRMQGIEILGVSADSEKRHQNFIAKFALPFNLIADEDHTLLHLYGVWGPKKFMGRTFDGIHRTTFVLDETHTIIGIIEKPKTALHAKEILKIYTS